MNELIHLEELSTPSIAEGNAVEVPAGYKRSEAGVIPKDWSVSSVSAEFNIQLGKMLDGARNVGIPKPYIGNRSVLWGGFDLDDLRQVPMTPSDLQRFRLRRNDLLVCEGGEIGRAAIWNEPIPECYYQKALHRLRPRGKYDVFLMMSFLNLWTSTGYLANYVTQTSIAHLPKDKLEIVPLPVPPEIEQRAIAEALSDMDGLLAALEALIVKKRAIKKATMQQLLTGKTRLPGFSGAWETKLLCKFAAIRNQKVIPSQVDPETPCVELEHITQRDGLLLGFSTARDSTSSKYHFLKGDVLFGRLRPYLRKFWHADFEGICTTEIWPLAVNAKHASSGFLRALVETDRFIEMASISYGTHMPRADWGIMRNLEIPLPTLEEQDAIAAVLSDMNAEIAALEARRDKTRAIKQGMMQQLLTGRIRLVEPEQAEVNA
jgi:type I restriction enzyme S subunit